MWPPRSCDEVGSLPQRSARYRDFLEPQGYEEELRGVFRSGGRTWGVVALFRDRGRDPFDTDAVSVLSAISSVVADALRTHATITVAPTGLAHSPGLMLFDDSATVMSVNDSASRWLEDLFGQGTDWIAELSDPERLDTNPAVPLIPLLFLSAHTVRDHIKSVFDKIGVTSRSELVAKLFADHYTDPFHETLVDVS